MEKRDKIIYWISTGLISAMLLMSASMYFFKYEETSTSFEGLGYGSFIVYPLAIAKILGLIAIWTRKSSMLKEWAYAGYFFVFTLAFLGHLNAGDGQWMMPIIATILLIVSYWYDKKVFGS